ncbi:MAG: glycosyltransferase [Bacteroidaceae bacterium]|nr:glycosyltransferase [Bacteroidaceae bacterium]
MEKKHIIIVGPAYPYRGGIADFNERLAREFQREGHKVTIYTFTLQYPGFLFPGKTQYSTSPAPGDLTIVRKVNSINPLNWVKVGREIRRQHPDMVMVRFWLPFLSPCLGTIARIISKDKGIKVVSLLDNVVPHEHRIGDKVFARYMIKSVGGYVAMSESVLADAKSFDDTKPYALTPHPLYDNFGDRVSRDEAIAHLGLDADTRYILFFGLIRDYKGLDLLLRAFADSRLRNKKTKLIVAGEFYSNAELYEQLERNLDIAEHIVWYKEFIPADQVRYFFAAADLVAQPYKTATQSGITQIAYHFERPMLVTDVGGLAEIVPHGKVGYVVKPEADAIADALVDFIDNHHESDYHEGILQEKTKYAWSNMTAALVKVADESATKR